MTVSTRVARFALFALVLTPPTLSAQAPPALAEAVRLLRSGDALTGLMSLNDVVNQPGNDAATMARIHAFRAQAYLMLDQPERAKAAMALSLKADPNVTLAAGEFTPAVIALFDDARKPPSTDPEAAGQTAELERRFQQAFLSYLTAYQALPNPAPDADDRRLRERIIRVVQRLDTAPAIPAEAREHVRKADALLEAEAILGGAAGSSQTAATELRMAVRSAPWWPDAAFKLAQISQKLQRVDEALLNLAMYRLADPAGYAASAEKANPRAPAAPVAPAAPAAPAAVGTVVVYRPSMFIGSAARAKVECNGVRMADLQNGRVVRFTAPVGDQALNFAGKKLTVKVEGGQTYYYRIAPAMMGMSLKTPTAAEAAAEFKEENVKDNDAKRTMSSECKPVAAGVKRPGN